MTDILSKVAAVDQQISDSRKKVEKSETRRTKVADSNNRRKLADARNRSLRVRASDSYKSNFRRIKDELVSTESTEEAIAVVENAITELPAEEVAIAVVEVLAETIDKLTEKLESEEIEEPAEEPIEEPIEGPIEDSYNAGDIFDEDGVIGKIIEVIPNEDGTQALRVEVVNEEGDVTTEEIIR